MFKKTLIAAAALSMLALGTSAANAHGHHGYGHGFNFVLDLSDYDGDCYYRSRPVTIKLWDDYSDSYYFKTVYRQVKVCY
jgi:hypothetical protein